MALPNRASENSPASRWRNRPRFSTELRTTDDRTPGNRRSLPGRGHRPALGPDFAETVRRRKTLRGPPWRWAPHAGASGRRVSCSARRRGRRRTRRSSTGDGDGRHDPRPRGTARRPGATHPAWHARLTLPWPDGPAGGGTARPSVTGEPAGRPTGGGTGQLTGGDGSPAPRPTVGPTVASVTGRGPLRPAGRSSCPARPRRSRSSGRR